ncbi:hypothetical protein SPRA44_330106 [Serratia proteamaculans]|uniref:hypothetical protein n=1 Tax=Serratia proteamaculans TaxID=28151 RepID=UPI0009F7ED5B|nr:hypothetical protein [Serratia proteamaculans]SMB35795.1 hypothetical protein SPRA44_330106 [Serratia proteamaculans]
MELLRSECVLITRTQLTVANETYILSGVTLIKKKKAIHLYPRTLVMLFMSFFLGGLIGIPESWCIAGILLSPITARWEDKNHKTMYRVLIGMSVGTFKVVESDDEEYIDEVMSTLKGAVANIHCPLCLVRR